MSNQLFEIVFLLHVAGSKQLIFMSIISIFGVKARLKISSVTMPTINPTVPCFENYFAVLKMCLQK